MMVISMLGFSIGVFFISYLLSKAKTFDRGQLALYITLIAWGSLLLGSVWQNFLSE